MNICPCNLATCIRGATSKPANTANGEKDLLESLRVASGLALALEGVRVLDEMNADGSVEQTNDPLYADRRNFYKVEAWRCLPGPRQPTLVPL
jgi:hypothetical protein